MGGGGSYMPCRDQEQSTFGTERRPPGPSRAGAAVAFTGGWLPRRGVFRPTAAMVLVLTTQVDKNERMLNRLPPRSRA